MCFGVADERDAGFGLSPVQRDRNASPELWQDSQPGMAYLDAACIPDGRKAMPLRTWYWGDGQKGTARIGQHALAYPASARPLDTVTAGMLKIGRPPASVAATADQWPEQPAQRPSLHIVRPPDEPADLPGGNGGQDEPDDTDWPDQPDDMDDENEEDDMRRTVKEGFGPGEADLYDADAPIEPVGGERGRARWDGSDPDAEKPRMSTEKSREAFDTRLRELKAAGKDRFQIMDVIDLTTITGHSRAWLYGEIRMRIAAGTLTERGGYPTIWVIRL
jgi:hypothetical protein